MPGPGFEPRSPALHAGDPGSNPGPGENFDLKLTTQDLPEGYSEKLSFNQNLLICVVNIKTPK